MLIVVVGSDRDRASLLLGLNRDLLETVFIRGAFGSLVHHFRFVPATNSHAPIEGIDRYARRSTHCKRSRFFGREPIAINSLSRSNDGFSLHAGDRKSTRLNSSHTV